MIETYKGVVHPVLCDVMGHMTTRHYAAAFDDASYHLAHACNLPVDDKNGFVDLELTLKFLAELRTGDIFVIRSAITGIGNSSFGARHKMVNCMNNSVAAVQEATYACFDLVKRKSVPLPDAFRERAESLLISESD
ncbi:acyl-CoA thioesterase [Emcibacter nanhaiensis]|uniref:Acyl-CoA thioesterase n=1 Tax=Emcibacter nanhaiensis TaxID=1505037 RepID=A0A501PLP4_9PROT|nr:thioesterase family protein [Emcibacter nanhaiensis]TPD60761.1 acyl-CoA thioesterase [Emcibacter nanhaiensis]